MIACNLIIINMFNIKIDNILAVILWKTDNIEFIWGLYINICGDIGRYMFIFNVSFLITEKLYQIL
jgi:hypothetical protein